MIEDYKFKNIEKYLKKDSGVGKDILDAFSTLTEAAIVSARLFCRPEVNVYCQ